MRAYLMTTGVLAVVVAAPSAVQAQRMVTGVVPTGAAQLRVTSLGSLGASTMTSGEGMRRVGVRATAAPPGVRRADSLASHDTHAEAGAIIGGVASAVVGGLAFAHWTHRAGAVNNGTGTVGGAVVGAGLVGGLGALAGLLIGSAIPR